MTYTYDQENVPLSKNGYLTLDRKEHSLFMKRLRKELNKEGYRVKLKYYVVGEYGGQTERPHYHSILFNLPEKYIVNEHKLEKIWKQGRVQADECTGASIAYVCGYVNKQTFFKNLGEKDDRTAEFSFMSKGLGTNYLTEAKIKSMRQKLNPYLTVENGQKIPLPRYYKEKVFNEQERLLLAELALEYLEENTIFASELQKQEYILNEAKQRRRQLHTKRRKI